MKSTEHSYHSKYIILEAKHKRYIYKHKFSPKTNPRDHEKVLLTRVFISLKSILSSNIKQCILVRYLQVPMHNARNILVIDTN